MRFVMAAALFGIVEMVLIAAGDNPVITVGGAAVVVVLIGLVVLL